MNTTQLLDIMCTLVATSVILWSLKCIAKVGDHDALLVKALGTWVVEIRNIVWSRVFKRSVKWHKAFSGSKMGIVSFVLSFSRVIIHRIMYRSCKSIRIIKNSSQNFIHESTISSTILIFCLWIDHLCLINNLSSALLSLFIYSIA